MRVVYEPVNWNIPEIYVWLPQNCETAQFYRLGAIHYGWGHVLTEAVDLSSGATQLGCNHSHTRTHLSRRERILQNSHSARVFQLCYL